MAVEIELEESSSVNPSDTDPLLQNHQNAGSDSPSLTDVTASSEIEMKYEDIEAGSIAAACRICLECDGEEGRSLMFFFVL